VRDPVEIQTSVFNPNRLFGSHLKYRNFYFHRPFIKLSGTQNLNNLKIPTLSIFKNSKNQISNKLITKGNNGGEQSGAW